jgi:hypothetical protein
MFTLLIITAPDCPLHHITHSLFCSWFAPRALGMNLQVTCKSSHHRVRFSVEKVFEISTLFINNCNCSLPIVAEVNR